MSERPRPSEVCRQLLSALDASEGRRRRRKRDTTPDSIGLGIKRGLLVRVVADDPPGEDFEGWLDRYCVAAADISSMGGVRAMALEVFAEWRLVDRSPAFSDWLARGAPSDDATP